MGYKKKQIVEAAAVSDGQVAIMRRIQRQLGADAAQYERWWSAHRATKGIPSFPEEDDERQQRLDAMAQDYADRLSKQFGSKLAENTEVAAHALSIHFGRRLAGLFAKLKDHVDEFDDPDADF